MYVYTHTICGLIIESNRKIKVIMLTMVHINLIIITGPYDCSLLYTPSSMRRTKQATARLQFGLHYLSSPELLMPAIALYGTHIKVSLTKTYLHLARTPIMEQACNSSEGKQAWIPPEHTRYNAICRAQESMAPSHARSQCTSACCMDEA